jgi:hypothetical protein
MNNITKKAILDLIERSVWTFIQAFLGMVLIDPSQASWKPALIAAGIAAIKALSVGMSHWNSPNAPTPLKGTLDFVVDTSERAIWTFIQTFLGAMIATGSFTGSILVSALVAGGISAVKNVATTIAAQTPLSSPSLSPPK